MKKITLALVFAACASALGDSAQAEIHQYMFTAAVESISYEEILGTPDPDAGRKAADAIAIGDTVTGHFSIDTNAPLLDSFSPDTGYEAAVYYNTGLPLLSIQFDESQQSITVWPDRSQIRVDDSTVSYYHDQFSVYGAQIYDRLYVNFSGPTTTVLDSTAIDIATLGDFPDRRFVYEHLTFVNEYWQMTTVQGALTSLTLVAIVPEPAMYGMLAVGLGLLAWRQRARSGRDG